MNRCSPRPATIVRWLAALVTLVLAAALCLSCLELYRAGTAPENLTAEGVRINDIYTRENVGRQLAKIAPAAISWAILLILAGMQPREPEKRLPIDPENALRLLRPRIIPTGEMEAIRNRREWAEKIVWFAILLAGGWILYYVSDRALFTLWDLEFVMGQMVRSTWAASLVVVVLMCLCAWWEGRSYEAEWQAAKNAPKRASPAEKPAPRSAFPVNIPRAILLIAALALIVAGILNGGMYDVLVKAINICTECIGLG